MASAYRSSCSGLLARIPAFFRAKTFLYPAFLVLFAILLYFLTAIPDILQQEFHHPDDNFKLLNFLLTTGLYIVLLDFFIRCQYVGWILWLPFMLFQGLRVYMYHVMGLQMIQNHVAVFMDTNWKEASAYCSWQNLVLLAAFLAANVLLYTLGRKLLPRTAIWKHGLVLLCELLALFALTTHLSSRSTPRYCSPLRSAMVSAYRVKMILLQNDKTPELMLLRRIPTADQGASSYSASAMPTTIIYVIGESVRADHLQINGYHRRTTPCLARRQENGELLSFRDVLSYGTGTYEAMLGLLTNATNEQREPSVGSFVPLFNKYGYETSVVTNLPKGFVMTFTKLTEACRNFLYYESEYCDRLLEHMENLKQGPSLPRLVIIQTNGSHYRYNERYPHESHAVFKPHDDPTLSTGNESLVNAYDNSIVYTDYMLDAIMDIYADSSAVLVYCSDHAESLGENGRFLHVGPLTATEQRRVPLIIWGSEAFRREHADMWENMKGRTSDPVQQGHLFHTILSLGGIESAWKRRDMDLTQPKDSPQPEGSDIKP